MITTVRKHRVLSLMIAVSSNAGAGVTPPAVDHNLVFVPPGEVEAIWLSKEFRPAKSGSRPLISVDGFSTMKYPVTQAQYAAFIQQNPQWQKQNIPKIFADETYLAEFSGQTNVAVTAVSWFAAAAYCDYYSMRLPTLVEWEYMASAPEKNSAVQTSEYVLKWYTEPKSLAQKSIGSTFENKLGVWDLHGLNWEWVDDFNSIFVATETRDPTGKDADKFCGSGSLGLSDRENYASFMRFAFRSALKGTSTVWNLGFRCVQSHGGRK